LLGARNGIWPADNITPSILNTFQRETSGGLGIICGDNGKIGGLDKS